MALPPHDQRNQYLRYEGLQYSDADIVDFEARLARIYRKEVHRVQVFNFGGLSDLMAEGLSARMLMEHKDAQGVSLLLEPDSARQIPDKEDLRDYWIGISSGGDFLGTAPSYTSIRDLILRPCHGLIACSIVGRSPAPEKVLKVVCCWEEEGALISGGQFMCVDINDTWAWVAMGPKRQLDVAAGTPRVSQYAPVVDEGDQTVPAPIHEALAEQHEVIGVMAKDFSRFTVWAANGIAQLLDSARVTYMSYSETRIPYQRHVRRRTDGANTSVAQQDQQQPDP
ncbi:hypothetical protein Tco_0367123 [Tanacetum coccineum]